MASRPNRAGPSWRAFLGEMSVPALLCAYATHYYLSVKALPRPETNLLLIAPVYWILMTSSALYLGLRLRELLRSAPEAAPQETRASDAANAADVSTAAGLLKPIAFIVLTIACVWLMPWLGFATTLASYTLLMLLALGVRSLRMLALVPILLATSLWMTMEWFLNLRLPVGVFY